MYFTNIRSINRNNIISNITNNKPNMQMQMGISNRYIKPTSNTIVKQTTPVNESNKILWGPPVWFFMHTMAEKIKPEYYATNRTFLFDIIKQICNNLPCPSCAKHATEYISKIDFNSLKTKDDLIMFLFQFHNSVNKRKNYPEFPVEELRSKYEKANFAKIIQYFLYYYKMEHHSVRMIADSMHRIRSAININEWLMTNRHIFNY